MTSLSEIKFTSVYACTVAAIVIYTDKFTAWHYPFNSFLGSLSVVHIF